MRIKSYLIKVQSGFLSSLSLRERNVPFIADKFLGTNATATTAKTTARLTMAIGALRDIVLSAGAAAHLYVPGVAAAASLPLWGKEDWTSRTQAFT